MTGIRGLIVRSSLTELRTVLLDRNVQIARSAAKEIDAYMDVARRDLATVTDILLLLDRKPRVADVLLQNHVLSTGIFESVAVMDRSGRVLARSFHCSGSGPS